MDSYLALEVDGQLSCTKRSWFFSFNIFVFLKNFHTSRDCRLLFINQVRYTPGSTHIARWKFPRFVDVFPIGKNGGFSIELC